MVVQLTTADFTHKHITFITPRLKKSAVKISKELCQILTDYKRSVGKN